jgi:hypothetical protein
MEDSIKRLVGCMTECVKLRTDAKEERDWLYELVQFKLSTSTSSALLF